MDSYSIQRTLNGLLGSTVQHFITNGSAIRIPGNKHEFGGGTSVIRHEFKIDQTIAAIVFGKIRAKVIKGLFASTRLFNLDSLLVYNFVNIVSKLESSGLEFESLKGGGNFVVYNNTGGLSLSNR